MRRRRRRCSTSCSATCASMRPASLRRACPTAEPSLCAGTLGGKLLGASQSRPRRHLSVRARLRPAHRRPVRRLSPKPFLPAPASTPAVLSPQLRSCLHTCAPVFTPPARFAGYAPVVGSPHAGFNAPPLHPPAALLARVRRAVNSASSHCPCGQAAFFGVWGELDTTVPPAAANASGDGAVGTFSPHLSFQAGLLSVLGERRRGSRHELRRGLEVHGGARSHSPVG